MSQFYTSVVQHFGKFLVRGWDNETKQRFTYKFPIRPYLFTKSKSLESDYHTISGLPVDRMDFDSSKDARNFIERYKGVAGFDIYGMDRWTTQGIYELFKGEVPYNPDLIKIAKIDIETGMNSYGDETIVKVKNSKNIEYEISINDLFLEPDLLVWDTEDFKWIKPELSCFLRPTGFPEPSEAANPITAITMKCGDIVHVFGCGKFVTKRTDIAYHKCSDELDLLKEFVNKWVELDFDIVTGWNSELFDAVYIVNRIIKVLGVEWAEKLSPWGVIKAGTKKVIDREYPTYDIYGIIQLDYLPMYKKFMTNVKILENYKLDTVAEEELGEKKVDYSEYGHLLTLYRKNFQLFMEYNIQDVEIVEKLEDKLKFIELVYAICYDAKINLDDVFSPVLIWDSLIHKFLMDQKIVVNAKKWVPKTEQIAGAYVKEPIPRQYNWLASFDVKSMYPYLIIQNNISAEMFIQKIDGLTVDDLFEGKANHESLKNHIKKQNVALSASGCLFDKDREGFLPAVMKYLLIGRDEDKRKMIYADQQKQLVIKQMETDDSLELKAQKKHWEREETKYNAYQNSKKIVLNAGYGVLSNEYFRWYDDKLAESITLSGQLAIRWVERALNEHINRLMKNEIPQDYVIGIDTDSLIMCLDDVVSKLIPNQKDPDKITDFISKLCSEVLGKTVDSALASLAEYTNAKTNALKMKREVIASSAIYVAKKHYLLNIIDKEGVRFAEPKLDIKGLEIKKTQIPKICRERLKDAAKLLINNKSDELEKFLVEFKEEFWRLPSEVIAFPKSANDIKKWEDRTTLYKKGTPIQCRASILYNNKLKELGLANQYTKIYNGDRVKFIYLIPKNPTGEDVIGFLDKIPPEFDLEQWVDYELMWNKVVISPLKVITDCVGLDIYFKATLDQWFN